MIKTIVPIAALLLSTIAFTGNASAQDSGPNTPACADAKAATSTAQTSLGELEAALAGLTPETEEDVRLAARQRVTDARIERDRLLALEVKVCTPPTTTTTVPRDRDRDRDRDRYRSSRECREAITAEDNRADSLRDAIVRLNDLSNRSVQEDSPGGTSVTDGEQNAISDASRIVNNRRVDLDNATNDRRRECRDDRHGRRDVDVTVVPAPPGVVYLPAPPPVVLAPVPSGGQVSQIPQGSVDTGDGSVSN